MYFKFVGHVEVDVRIGDLDGKKFKEVKALVDTGATFTVLPENVARELNLPLMGEKVRVSTAKGYDELELTHALIEIDGKRRIVPVLVSRHIERTLLGVITLEAMQLRVNPITEKLEEYTALLY
ncbi:MAG: retroviral-like aspartic protease family protein [Candidatus Bathyarchaeia archaeon]